MATLRPPALGHGASLQLPRRSLCWIPRTKGTKECWNFPQQFRCNSIIPRECGLLPHIRGDRVCRGNRRVNCRGSAGDGGVEDRGLGAEVIRSDDDDGAIMSATRGKLPQLSGTLFKYGNKSVQVLILTYTIHGSFCGLHAFRCYSRARADGEFQFQFRFRPTDDANGCSFLVFVGSFCAVLLWFLWFLYTLK